MDKKFIIVEGNIQKQILGLKSIGYNLNSAISDLIDNSIDARAENINILIKKDEKSLSIIDDGYGMKKEELIENLGLGSSIFKEENSLGKFGYGLKSASMSQVDVFSVVSKKEDGNTNEYVLDLNEIVKKNKWGVLESSKNIDLIKTKQGTAIVWNDVEIFKETLENNCLKEFVDIVEGLRKYIGIHFYKFIEEGIKIKINNNEIHAVDPFYKSSDFTKRLITNDRLEFKKDRIKINCYQIPKDNENTIKKIESKDGIYIFRNKRLIKSLRTSDIYKIKTNYLDRIRVEINITGMSDKSLKLNIQKQDLILPLKIKRKINETLNKSINKIKESNIGRVKKMNIRNELDNKKVVPLWNKGKTAYEAINMENDLVRAFAEKYNVDPKDLRFFTYLISNNNYNSRDNDETQIYKIILNYVTKLKNKNIEKEECIGILSTVEPFNKNKDLIIKVVEDMYE